MGKLFGTDGIRGLANEDPMTPEMAVKIGKAIAFYFKEKQKGEKNKKGIIVGRDTRISGPMLENALVSGITSMGVDVYLTGVLPTPGIARMIVEENALAGVVISASHNPYFDNGIKIFNEDGFKLSDKSETEIENHIMGKQNRFLNKGINKTGRIYKVKNPVDNYVAFLKKSIPNGISFDGLKIIFDCANGATFQAAPILFSGLGIDSEFLFVEPDGMNINDNCGSEHPDALTKKVLEQGADMGLAFDGDGDRLIAVDNKGTIATGDQIIAVFAHHLKNQNKLKENKAVTTIMSNMGLGVSLKELGITHGMSNVGDRYVMEKMKTEGAVLGGENSGHIIFLDHHTTGDGMLAGLKLLEAVCFSKKPLSEFINIMDIFPQKMINVEVKSKPELESVPLIMEAIQTAEHSLGEKGRVLVRYSGTQPICRVMVEGPTEEETKNHCKMIAEAVEKHLG